MNEQTKAFPSAEDFEVGDLPTSVPRTGVYPAQLFVHAAGVAIFHVASSRVVVCYHPREKHWFLPKGRRDVGETLEVGACREGFEESGYRNRLLPLPLDTRQPKPFVPENVAEEDTNVRPDFITEPVYLEVLPLGVRKQYILSWYIAETLPPEIEEEMNAKENKVRQRPPYSAPPLYPKSLRLTDRLAQEQQGYEPVRHENMGVDADEALYESYLLPIEEACQKLKQAGIMKHVVRIGWAAILSRLEWEGCNT